MDDKNPSAQRLIGHDFHLRHGIRLLTICVAGVIMIVGLLYKFTPESQGGSYYEAHYSIYRMKTDIVPLVFASNYTAAILGLIALAVIITSVRYSHRIAGPIYRLEKCLDALGEGDLTVDVRFRGYDTLVQIADETNAAVRRLNHEVRSCHDAIELIGKGEARVAELLQDERLNAEEIRKAAEEIKMGVSELKAVTDRVKTGE